jgi:curli production assembly/transport component CsgG
LIFGGLGVIREEKGDYATQDWVATLQGGAGVEFMVTKRLGIELAGFTSYFLSDELDGLDLGSYNDFYWGGTIGLKYYVGKPPLLKNLK